VYAGKSSQPILKTPKLFKFVSYHWIVDRHIASPAILTFYYCHNGAEECIKPVIGTAWSPFPETYDSPLEFTVAIHGERSGRKRFAQRIERANSL